MVTDTRIAEAGRQSPGGPASATPCGPRLARVLLARWQYILRPHRAARIVLAASPRVAAAAILLAVAELSVAVSVASEATWYDACGIACAMALALGFASWLELPQIYRSGSLLASYWRALCACSGAMGFITVAVVAAGVLVGSLWRLSSLLEPLPVLLATILAVRWLDQAARGQRTGKWVPSRAPRCEGCGYDLTHRPADGRCPECGFEIALSLTSRPGSRWQIQRGMRTWIATTWELLTRPARFYRRLRMRSQSAPAAEFASTTGRAISVGAFIFFVAGHLIFLPRFGVQFMARNLFKSLCLSMAAFAGCWFGHRLIGAAVFACWALWRPLPDGRWAARVIAYESAFLWVFCTYWGMLATSVLMFGPWISQLMPLLGPSFAGVSEAMVVGAGTCALGAVWLWRYRIAYRAIRWSNS